MMKPLASAMSSARDNSSMYGESAASANVVTPMSIRAAVTVVASVPILIVYPFLQKYFVKGVMIGSVKG
jgi:putative aldouronate transport system permease protein